MEKTKKSKILIILAWTIPILVFLIILYFNFLPFGFQKTLTIDVGELDDDKGIFYLEENPDLGSRQLIEGQSFRYLEGSAFAVYTPKQVFKDATIEATIEGQDVSFLVPPDIEKLNWDYVWDYNAISQDFVLQGSEQESYSLFTGAPAQEIEEAINIDPQKEFAIEIDWYAKEATQLLEGDIYLAQTLTEIILEYQQTKIVYSLPDFFIGENQNILIVSKDNYLYLYVNKEYIDKKLLPKNIEEENNDDEEEEEEKENEEKEEKKETLFIKKSSNTEHLKIYSEIKPQLTQLNGCLYLDGQSKLVLPDSADDFEIGPFAFYVEWIPEKMEDNQQIIGHYNWEIHQNKDNVQFFIGRMNEKDGAFYSINHEIDNSFFNQKHHLIAIYNPASNKNPNGYMELFIDDIFITRKYFADEIIWTDYSRDMSIGNTSHSGGKLIYFQGSICQINFVYFRLEPQTVTFWKFPAQGDHIRIPLWGNGKLDKINIKIKQ